MRETSKKQTKRINFRRKRKMKEFKVTNEMYKNGNVVEAMMKKTKLKDLSILKLKIN